MKEKVIFPKLVFYYLLILIFLLFNFSTNFYAKEADFAIKKTITFEIEENDSGYYDLKSLVNVESKYLSKESLTRNFFNFYESYYAPIKNVKSYFNGSRLSNNVSFENVNSEDIFIDNSKYYSIGFLKDIKIGDQIEYSYEQNYRDIAFIPIIQIPNTDYIEKFEIVIEHPEELRPEFEIFFPYKDLKYQIVREDEKTIVKFDPFYKIPDVEFIPFDKIAAAIMITLKKGNYSINPVQPKDFVQWYYKQFNFKQSFTQKQKSLFDSLFKNIIDTEGKLAAIDKYIKDNIRYIADEYGINSIVPREPSLVFERKYGDCKDRAFLASAIAKEYGINVYPVLVNTESALKFSGVHAWLFNHVICEYEKNGKCRFFDPTAKYNEFGSLPKYEHNKKALILDPNNPRLELIHEENPECLIEIDIKSHIDSLTKCKAIVHLNNEYGGYAKHAAMELTELKTENFISNLITSNLRNISIDYFKFLKTSSETLPEGNNNVSFSANADLSRFVISTSSNKYLLKIPFIFMDNAILGREKDTLPVYIPKELVPAIKLRIELEIPDRSSPNDSLIIQDSESNSLFVARSSVDPKGFLNLEYNLSSPIGYLEKNRKIGFINFCRNYLKNKNQMFQLSRKKL